MHYSSLNNLTFLPSSQGESKAPRLHQRESFSRVKRGGEYFLSAKAKRGKDDHLPLLEMAKHQLS